MKLKSILLLWAALLAAGHVIAEPNTLTPDEQAAGWQLLFDGKSLDGWVASDKPGTFSVQDGCIVTDGPRSHLYYEGSVLNHNFTNFEFRAEVMTFPKANSGVYIHTAFQTNGWPAKGYEIQINNSAVDTNSRTAGIFWVQDNHVAPIADNVWFILRIRVEGKHIQTWVNDQAISDYTEPPGLVRRGNAAGWVLSHGTFALQAHNRGSRAQFRTIAVRPLP